MGGANTAVAERVALGVCAAERSRRTGIPGCEVIGHDGLLICIANVDAPELNGVVIERAPADAEAALRTAEATLTDRGRSLGVDFQAGRHPGVDAAVRRIGLEREVERPGFAAPVASLEPPEIPEGVMIRPVHSAADRAAFAAVDEAAFEDPPEVASTFYAAGLARRRPEVAAFLAWDDEAPIASAAAYLHDDAVGVLGVGVVPRARRRGIGRAMTSCAAHAFPNADLAWLHPTDVARGMYERMGFESVSAWEVWVRP